MNESTAQAGTLNEYPDTASRAAAYLDAVGACADAGGFWIPNLLPRHFGELGVKGSEAAVLMVLLTYERRPPKDAARASMTEAETAAWGTAWPSLDTIGTSVGLHVVNVSRAVQSLARKGLIWIRHRMHASNVFDLFPLWMKLAQIVRARMKPKPREEGRINEIVTSGLTKSLKKHVQENRVQSPPLGTPHFQSEEGSSEPPQTQSVNLVRETQEENVNTRPSAPSAGSAPAQNPTLFGTSVCSPEELSLVMRLRAVRGWQPDDTEDPRFAREVLEDYKTQGADWVIACAADFTAWCGSHRPKRNAHLAFRNWLKREMTPPPWQRKEGERYDSAANRARAAALEADIKAELEASERFIEAERLDAEKFRRIRAERRRQEQMEQGRVAA